MIQSKGKKGNSEEQGMKGGGVAQNQTELKQANTSKVKKIF